VPKLPLSVRCTRRAARNGAAWTASGSVREPRHAPGQVIVDLHDRAGHRFPVARRSESQALAPTPYALVGTDNGTKAASTWTWADASSGVAFGRGIKPTIYSGSA
jgi:hypothetical protein